MDDATAATVRQLQIEDIDELLQRQSNGERSHARIALLLYRRDLNERHALLTDHRIAFNYSTAVRTDSGVLAAALRDEAQCSADRQLAQRLGGHAQTGAGPPSQPLQQAGVPLDYDLESINLARSIPPEFVFPVPRGSDGISRLNPQPFQPATATKSASTTVSLAQSPNAGQGESVEYGTSKRKRAASPTTESPIDLTSDSPVQWSFERLIGLTTENTGTKRAKVMTEEQEQRRNPRSATGFPTPIIRPPPIQDVCTGCTDLHDRKDMMEASCKHSFCRDCTANLVTVALEVGSNFPPSCCNMPVALDALYGHVSFELIWAYQQKQDEIEKAYTLPCATPWCETLIASDQIREKKEHCSTCSQDTCRDCKKQWHAGTSCKEREENEKLASLADAQGWRSCYNCGTFIDMIFGCNHMVCLCKAEFCFVCGSKWKTCKCAQFDDDLLHARAERVLERRQEVGQANDLRTREVQLDEIRRLLRRNRGHANWVREDCSPQAPGECEFCGFETRRFIMCCEHCHLEACSVCSRRYRG